MLTTTYDYTPADQMSIEDLHICVYSPPDKYELWTADQPRYGHASFDRTIVVYKDVDGWMVKRLSTWPIGRPLFQKLLKRCSRKKLEETLRTFMYEPLAEVDR